MRMARQRILAVVLSLSMALTSAGQLSVFAEDDTGSDLANGISSVTAPPADSDETGNKVITAFDDLVEISVPLGTSQEALDLPTSIGATVDEADASVAVTAWQPETEYIPDVPGAYAFVPTLGDGYDLAEGVTAPHQIVNIGGAITFAALPAENPYLAENADEGRGIRARSFTGTDAVNYGSQLNTNQKKIYDAMVTALVDKAPSEQYPTGTNYPVLHLDTPITFNTTQTITSTTAPYVLGMMTAASIKTFQSYGQAAMDAFMYDYPEVFWLYFYDGVHEETGNGSSGFSVGSTTTYTPNSKNFYVKDFVFVPAAHIAEYPNPAATASELSSELSSLTSALASNGAANASTVTKLLWIHDNLANIMTYDHTLSQPHIYHATGALIDGVTVCEGYAKSFKLMCDRQGIPCVLVVGEGVTNSGSEPHMWNYVRIGSKWYAVDMTWDDQDSINTILYDFFLVGRTTAAPNFGGITFGSSHRSWGDFSGAGAITFAYPALSEVGYLDDPEAQIPFTVTTAPTTSGTWTYGDPLSAVALPTGGTFTSANGLNIVINGSAGTYSWKNPAEVAGAGTGSQIAAYRFTPANPAYSPVEGSVTINRAKRAATVKAEDKIVLVGDPIPTSFTYVYENLANGDTASTPGLLLTQPTASCPSLANTNTPQSAKDITITIMPTAANYTFTEATPRGTVTVNERVLDNDGQYFSVTPSPNAEGWFNGDITLAPKGKDGFTYIGVNGSFASSHTVNGETSNGSVTLAVAKDSSGTIKTTDYPFSYKLDKTQPSYVDTTYVQTKDALEGTLTINGATDALSGVKSVTLTDPDGVSTMLTSGFAFGVYQSGNHTVTVTDNAGNAYTRTEVVTIRTLDRVGITLGTSSMSGEVITRNRGESFQLTPTAEGSATPDDYTFKWESSYPAAVTVDANGAVSCVGNGSAVITLSALGKADTFQVLVRSSTPGGTPANGNDPAVQIPPEALPDGITDASELSLIVTGMSQADQNQMLNDSTVASLVNAFGGTGSLLLDISLVLASDTNVHVQPKAPVTVSLPYPNGSDSSYEFMILHMDASGNVSNVTFSKTGSYLLLKVESFSTFAVFFKAPTPSRRYSSGGSSSSGGTSVQDGSVVLSSVWNTVRRQIINSKSGDTIKAKLADNDDRVPSDILKELKGMNVTLIIEWPDGRTIKINGKDIGNFAAYSFYSYKQLVALFGEAAVSTATTGRNSEDEEINNPSTGGDYIEISAPLPNRIIAQLPAIRPGIQTAPAKVPAAIPPIESPAVTPEAPDEQASAPLSGMLILVGLAILAVCGAGVGVFIYRRKKHSA